LHPSLLLLLLLRRPLWRRWLHPSLLLLLLLRRPLWRRWLHPSLVVLLLLLLLLCQWQLQHRLLLQLLQLGCCIFFKQLGYCTCQPCICLLRCCLLFHCLLHLLAFLLHLLVLQTHSCCSCQSCLAPLLLGYGPAVMPCWWRSRPHLQKLRPDCFDSCLVRCWTTCGQHKQHTQFGKKVHLGSKYLNNPTAIRTQCRLCRVGLYIALDARRLQLLAMVSTTQGICANVPSCKAQVCGAQRE
jgi:hypothetical protein